MKKYFLVIVYLGLVLTFFIPPAGNAENLKPGHALRADSGKVNTALGNRYESFSLERCIAIALEKNPEIAAVQWDVAAAGSRYAAARAAFWPQLNAEGAYQRHTDSQRLLQARYNGEVGAFDNDLLRGDLIAKLNLYAGGRMINEAAAVGRLAEAEKKRLIRTRDELIYSVAAVYYSILGQKQIISSLEFSKQALDENLKRTTQLYEARKAAKVDVLRMQVRLSDLGQNLIREKNVFSIQYRILFGLMGYDAVPDAVSFEGKLGIPFEPLVEVSSLIETALKNRPDYLAAKERVAAQSLKVSAAKAGHWPNINLVGAYGVRSAPNPEDVGIDAGSTENTGSVGVVLTIPLFDGGQISAKVREEAAILLAARERLKKMDLQIRQETETAAVDVISHAERVRATEKAIEQAKESFRIESLKYEMGKGLLTDMLDAQSAQLLSETTHFRACTDYYAAMAKLRLATGERMKPSNQLNNGRQPELRGRYK